MLQKLKSISIGVRLGIGFSLILLLFAIVSLFIINRMAFLSDLTNRMYRHPLTVSNAVLRVDGNIVRIHRSMKDVALAKRDAEIDEAVQIVDKYEQEVYIDFEIISDRFLGNKKLYEDAEKAFREWKPIRDEVIALMHQGKRDEAAAITKGKGARHVDKLNTAMHTLNDFARDKAREFLNETLNTRAETLTVVYVLVIVTILAGVIFVALLTWSITQPLSKLMGAVLEISLGNLDKRILVQSTDEIGQFARAFNGMAGKLKKFYEHLEEQVRNRTGELANTNKELKKEINERRQAEDKIKTSLKEKTVLLQEVHHRVKNNLQIIDSLINMQTKSIRNPQILQQFKIIGGRIKSMALIHEQLYQSSNLSEIDFADYAPNLIESLFHSYQVKPGKIRLNTDINRILLNINTAIPCGLIINELISNCLEHAFPGRETGELEVTFKSNNDSGFTLTVSDDGVGFPENTDIEKPKTLGLKIITGLIKQIDGILDFHSNEEAGTTFKITFKNI